MGITVQQRSTVQGRLRSAIRGILSTILLFAVLLTAPSAAAQEFRATLTGQVKDTQGGILPGVAVTATQTSTNTKSEAITDDSGIFTFAFLLPGTYTVTAELQGFMRLVRENVPVSTGQRVTLDLTLEVGAATESITVSADAAPLLSTGTASVGVVVEAEQIDNLPLSGRAPMSLVKLSAGVMDATNPAINSRPFDNSGTSNFSMGGGQNSTNEMLLDGAPNMAADRRVSYNPPADVVQEVKVETFQADATYGNSAGGTVNIVTKSGTNNLRGTTGWFTQPSSLFATPYFAKRAGQKSPPSDYNQWGATAGGPLVIPGVVNARNKVFWTFAYDAINNTRIEPVLTTVPTEAMRNGDFSALLSQGEAYRIYDPATAVVDGARRVRQPFPNNVIPADRISPIARAYLNYYPLPNQPGRANGQDNYLSQMQRIDTFYSLMGRTDINIDTRNRLMFKYHMNDRVEDMGNLFNNPATGADKPRNTWGSMLDYVHTLNSATIVNSRLGWTRFGDYESRHSTGFDMTSLGFPASLAAASNNLAMPLLTFGDTTQAIGAQAPTNIIATGTGFATPFDTFQWFTAVTAARGRMSWKYGADLRLLRESSVNYGHSSGLYNFGTEWTRGPFDNSAGAPHGQALASFLLGLPTSGQFDLNTARTNQALYTAFFIQNDWRVKNSLTLNLGLRYERETGTTERYDRTLVGFDEEAANGITAAAREAYARNPVAGLPASVFNPAGGPVFASDERRNVYDTANHSFSPRFGIAWTPDKLKGNTVIRGGFGIFYHTYGTTGIQQPGFSQTTAFVPTLDGYLTPAANLSNPFPGGIQTPVGAARGLDQNLGQAVTFTNPSLEQPYSRRYTAGVQHQIGKGLVAEINYAGSHFEKLPINYDLNYYPEEFLSTSGVRDQATINRLTANVPNPFQGLLPGTTLNGPTIQFEQLLRLYPQYAGVAGLRMTHANQGSADLQMVSFTLQKRFSGGMQVLGTYTLSRMYEETARLNASDAEPARVIANEDHPHRFVLSGVYELPFGRGRRFGAGMSPVFDAIAGGWTVSGIYTYQTGSVLQWGNVIHTGGDLDWNPRNIDRAFNVDAFNRVPAQQLDRNLRTLPLDFGRLRLDAINTLNVAFVKNANFGRGMRLQLRAEAFNALDRVQFAAPIIVPTQANFGQVISQANAPRTVQFGVRFLW